MYKDDDINMTQAKELLIRNLLTIINTPVIWGNLNSETKNKLVKIIIEYTKKSVENIIDLDFPNIKKF